MKNVVWIGRRQVRGLIILLALLPLIPSSFLIHTMWLTAEKDRQAVVQDMNAMFLSQLQLAVERFSTESEDSLRGEMALVRFMNHVFGKDLPMAILTPNGESVYQSAVAITQEGFYYRIVAGEFSEFEIFIDATPNLPTHIIEERRFTTNQTVLVLLATFLIAGGVWYAVNRGLRVDEIRKDLITTISHEIKTPVSAIKILAESMQMGQLDQSKQSEYLQLIADENERIEQLANRFLTYGRLEKGQLPIALEPISVIDAVDEVKSLVGPAFQAQSGTIDIRSEVDVTVLADREGMQIILTNLLENALKYGGEPPQVLVDLKVEKDRAVITICDNGAGIAKAERRAVFRRFYRSEGRLDDGQDGVGLGLAICQRVAKQMNARLAVIDSGSSPYDGAALQLSLPLSI